MRNSISSIESSIKLLYERFFQKLKINKKNGEFMRNSRWSFLKFPTYPFIGREYAQNEDCRVLFIGLEIGSDELPNSGIIDFEKKRLLRECSGVFSLGGIEVQATQVEKDVVLEPFFAPITKSLFDQPLDFVVETFDGTIG